MKDTVKVAMPKEKALAIVLALSALVLAGVLFWEWNQGLELQRRLTKLRTIPVTPVPEQKILPEFSLPEAEAGFPELLSRNLFAGNRRSVASAGKGGKGAMKKGQFVLVGVLITPKQRSALLRDVQTNKTETVALVGVVRGITLGEVEPTRVVLRQGAESEELILNVQAGPKLPTPAQGQPGVPPAPPVAAVPQPAMPAQPAPAASAASAPARPASGPRPPAPDGTTSARPADSVSAPKPSSNMPPPLPKK
ncbi:MAG: hypothetical protein Q7T69_19720 [Rhodoferax sp.]|nr:hypothetical protein [Rhodoferax sp.]